MSATPLRKPAQKTAQKATQKAAYDRQSVTAVLEEKVAQGDLHLDPAQANAAKALDRLHGRLIEKRKGSRFWKHLFFKRLRLKGSKTRLEALRGLYLWGKPGSGKSLLMDMFFESVEASPALTSLTRRRTHFLPFMEEMHAAIEHLNNSNPRNPCNLREPREPIERLAKRVAKESRLLCFDEFIVEDIADAMLMGRLFASLAARGVVLVATSNFAPEDLYKDGFKRDNFLPFLRLLRQAIISVQVCSKKDYRSVALARQGRDLWFRGREGEKRMRATFAQFVETQKENQALENQALENQFLPCEGRPILLRRTGAPSNRLRARGVVRNVVWCGFADLCQTARGVRDYNVLLDCCDVLFLADFPILDETERNGAKRFMRLVDLFYERRALVLCHSFAVSPRALYRGSSHAREFMRTASRLEEMLARAHALL